MVGEGRRARSGGKKSEGENKRARALLVTLCVVWERGGAGEMEGCGLEMCVESEGKERHWVGLAWLALFLILLVPLVHTINRHSTLATDTSASRGRWQALYLMHQEEERKGTMVVASVCALGSLCVWQQWGRRIRGSLLVLAVVRRLPASFFSFRNEINVACCVRSF